MRPDHHVPRLLASPLVLLLPIVVGSTPAQVPSPDQQMAAATLPLPDAMRAGARVIGWSESGVRTDLREGRNGMICIADEPGDERFRVLCYPASLEPLLSRSRQLRDEGLEEEERDRRLEEEVETGKIVLPGQPAVLHMIDAPAGSYDPATGRMNEEAGRIRIIFTPYQTAEAMGLPTERHDDMPWVMNSGELFSHIMIVGERGEPEGDEPGQ